MRKKALKQLLYKTDEKLKEMRLENDGLREKLSHFEQNETLLRENRIENTEHIAELERENARLRQEADEYRAEADAQISELETELNRINQELNQLKGEHFDACRYAEQLKEKLDVLTTKDTECEKEIITPEPPPKIQKIVSAEEKDKDAFDYASSVISKAVIDAASLKNKLSSYENDMTTELITLALGRTEMLKSDILQTVISDMVFEAKKQRIDSIYTETKDYFEGLLGQLNV